MAPRVREKVKKKDMSMIYSGSFYTNVPRYRCTGKIRGGLCPASKKGHEPCSKQKFEDCKRDFGQGGRAHLLVEDEFVSEKLDETNVEEDTTRHGIKHTCHVAGRCTIFIVSVANTDTNGHTDGRNERIRNTTQVGYP